MELNAVKQIFNSLPQNEQIELIKKEMPHSGTIRQLEAREWWSEKQWRKMVDIFFESTKWEQVEFLSAVDVHDQTYSIKGYSKIGNVYEAIGQYSCDELVEIEDIELVS